jgi:hypothetical protein
MQQLPLVLPLLRLGAASVAALGAATLLLSLVLWLLLRLVVLATSAAVPGAATLLLSLVLLVLLLVVVAAFGHAAAAASVLPARP